MNDDQYSQIIQSLAEYKEKIRHLLEWEREINDFKTETTKKIQHYDDYCIGNEAVPVELGELQDWQIVVDKDLKYLHERQKIQEKKSAFNEKWISRFLALGFVISLILIAVNIILQWMRL
jgi:hypothetical protein